MKRFIDNSWSTYPIQPSHFGKFGHLFNTFNNMETEISAAWLIDFAQDRGESWKPFTEAEINAYYVTKLGRVEAFWFNKLLPGFIVKEGDLFWFTQEFVCTAFSGIEHAPSTESEGGNQ